MCIIKNVNGSINALLYELNYVINSDEYGYNQEDSYIDYNCEECLKNECVLLTVNDVEILWILLRTFCSFDRNRAWDRQAVRSLFRFWNKSTNTHIQTILRALNLGVNPDNFYTLYMSYVHSSDSFVYIFECIKSSYKMFISPAPKTQLFVDDSSQILFGFLFNNKSDTKKFIEIHDINGFVKRHKPSISLFRHKKRG